jgi:energy-coupling factor transporter transmembrane protein EcfT
MMIVNLLVILVVAAVCLAVSFGVTYLLFLGVWTAAVFALRLRHKWLWIPASFPVFVLLFVVALVALFLHSTSPGSVFADRFGFPPPDDVADMRSSTWLLGDSGYAYLAFTADPATVQRIIDRGMTPAVERDPRSVTIGRERPSWWNPSPTDLVYAADLTGRVFMTVETEVLHHDPVTGRVHYYWYGID